MQVILKNNIIVISILVSFNLGGVTNDAIFNISF